MPAPEVPIALQRPYAVREVRRLLDGCEAAIKRSIDLMVGADLGIIYLEWCGSDLRKAQQALREIAAHDKIDLMEQG